MRFSGRALNLAFGIASYLMVRFQLFLNKRHSGYQKLTVFVAKWVDNVADGATFFSTNITYTALISTLVFSNDTSLLFWELLLFYVLAAAFCVVFTAVLESVPYLWYTEPPTAAALTTNRMISDWYYGLRHSSWTIFTDVSALFHPPTHVWYALPTPVPMLSRCRLVLAISDVATSTATNSRLLPVTCDACEFPTALGEM